MKEKKIFISDLLDHVGEEITELFFVRGMLNSKNRQGTAWTSVGIADRTGMATAKIWSEFFCDQNMELEEQVCEIFGKVDIYNGVPGISITSMKKAESFQQKDFAKSLDESVCKALKGSLSEWINQIKNPRYRALLERVFAKNADKMLGVPASVNSHHVYNGGCMEHTLEVVCMADRLAEHYYQMEEYPVNRDLLLTAALLHDVGCTTCYEPFPLSKKTVRGSLIGVALESSLFCVSYNSLLSQESRVSDTTELTHCILASHDESVGGVKPAMLEAIILHDANMSSIHANGYSTCFRKDEIWHPEMKKNRTWIYSSLHETVLYRKEVEKDV